jgi:RNA polymerase sigma-70 factor (ECF subfamily)
VTDCDRQLWFATEILPHEGTLRSYLRRFLEAPEDLQDALQETYARLLSLNEAEIAHVRVPRGFLFTAARNVALDMLRKRQIVCLEAVAELDTAAVVDESPGADEQLNARQELVLLAEVIASLPERCRQVLTLRKLYGMSQKEIASQLGISQSTVEKHVATGVRLCADRFAMMSSDLERNEKLDESRTRIRREH